MVFKRCLSFFNNNNNNNNSTTLNRFQQSFFEFVLYCLVGIETFLELEKTQKYGSDGFNVADFYFLNQIIANNASNLTTIIMIMRLLIIILCFVLASGRLKTSFETMLCKFLLASVYGVAYFSSQIDNYQHHYLICLLLVLIATNLLSKLLVFQVSWVYFCTTLTKLHWSFLDGSTLRHTLGGIVGKQINQINNNQWLWIAMSIAAVVVELLLSIGLLRRRLWPCCALIGISLHLSLEFSGFAIGLFSYLMIGFWITLILPRFTMQLPSISENLLLFTSVCCHSIVFYFINTPQTIMMKTIIIISLIQLLISRTTSTKSTIVWCLIAYLTFNYNPLFGFHLSRADQLVKQLQIDNGMKFCE
jgi:hypothetical protein